MVRRAANHRDGGDGLLDAWLRRSLDERFGDVAREPIPADLLRLLTEIG